MIKKISRLFSILLVLFACLTAANAAAFITDTLEEGGEKTYSVDGKEYLVQVQTITDTSPYQVKFKINYEITDALKVDDEFILTDFAKLKVLELLPCEAGDVTQDKVTFTVYAPCIPNWQTNYEDCLITNKKLKYYTDANNCGITANIPSNNNAYDYCDYADSIRKLKIENIEVKVDGKIQRNLEDGDTIINDAMPESEVEIKMDINNYYSIEEDINLEDIEVTMIIEGIDNGNNLVKKDDAGSIRAQDSKSLRFLFDIPKEVKADEYDIVIKIRADDDNGHYHELQYYLILKVDKKKHDIEIENAELNPSLIECKGKSTLDVSIRNMGSDEEEKARLTVINSDLGIDFEKIFELSEAQGDDAQFRKSLVISGNNQGTYPIDIKVYSDLNVLMDSKTVNLKVNACTEPAANKTSINSSAKKSTIKTTKKNGTKEMPQIIEPAKKEPTEKCFMGLCFNHDKKCFLWWCW